MKTYESMNSIKRKAKDEGEKADTYLLNNFTKRHITTKDGKEEKPQIKLFVFYVRRT